MNAHRARAAQSSTLLHRFAAIILSAAASGCVSFCNQYPGAFGCGDIVARETQDEMARRKEACDTSLQTWVGSSVSDLIASWGPPSQVSTLPDGRTVDRWDWAGEVALSAQDPNAPRSLARAQREEWGWCSKWFVADKTGHVESFHYDGSSGSRSAGCY
jgi:hypothetical protein